MFLRFYAHVRDTTKAMEFYSNVFFGTPNKNAGANQGHNSIRLFDNPNMNMLIYGPTDEGVMAGSLIIRFEDSEGDIYKKVNEKIKHRKDIDLAYFMKSYVWGTTITRFTDPFGYNWSIEISTEALNK